MMQQSIVKEMPRKSLGHAVEETKSEIQYILLGLKELFLDHRMKEKNKTELPLKTGKIAVITGGSRGIGKEVVKMLVQCDVHVIIGCRSTDVAENLLPQFREQGVTTGSTEVYKLDTSSLESVRTFARTVKEKHKKIHYLINNAGILFGPYTESVDGYELQFATNYLGHCLLTHLLLPELIAAGESNANSRIVNVSSCAHTLGKINFEDINYKERYIPAAGYSQSKLALILFAFHLERYMRKKGYAVQVHAVHPGLVQTEIFDRTFFSSFVPKLVTKMYKTPHQGAVPIVYTCMDSSLEGNGGNYISNCQIYHVGSNACSIELQEQLFEFTTKLLNIEEFGKL